MAIAFCLIILGFILSFVLTGFFRQFALRKEILDLPNERSLHQQPTPRGGGIVFIAVFYAALIFLWHTTFLPTDLLLALFGSVPIVIIGFLDDIYSIAVRWRLMTQGIAAIWSLYCLHLLNYSASPLLWVITIWFTNLYNFMDGIDGLAASEAVFIALTTGLLLFSHHAALGLPLLALAAAVFGFLFWNWQPAKVFMGDVGSGFLGFTFAIFMWATAEKGVLPVIFWWFLLSIFLVFLKDYC